MGKTDVPKVAFVALGVFSLGLILQIVALATTSWVARREKEATIEFGLFKACSKAPVTDKKCISYFDDEYSEFYKDREWYRGVQAMECLGLVGYLAAVVFMILGIFTEKLQMLRLGAAITAFVTGVFVIIGVGIYGAKAPNDNYFKRLELKLHYSFGLAVASGILAFVGGGLGVASK